MKFLKAIIGVQAAVMLYLFWENSTIKEQIVESAVALSRSTKRIERLNDELEHTKRNLSMCRYTLDKYSEHLLNDQHE